MRPKLACRALPPALLIVLACARTHCRLRVPIALGKEAEAVVAPVVARNGDTDRRPARNGDTDARSVRRFCRELAQPRSLFVSM
jgi:hypothetical protein